MNPISSVAMAVGAVSSLFSIGTSMIMQGNNLHRQLTPPVQAQQQMQCPPPRYKLEVLVTANGKRQLVCTEAQSE